MNPDQGGMKQYFQSPRDSGKVRQRSRSAGQGSLDQGVCPLLVRGLIVMWLCPGGVGVSQSLGSLCWYFQVGL